MALIFLLVMTLLGVFGMNISRMENRMAGNNQFQTTALANAERALAAGERQIENLSGKLPFMDWNTPGDAWYDRSDTTTKRIDTYSPDWEFPYHAVTDTSRYVIEFTGIKPVPGYDTASADTAKCLNGRCVWVFIVSAQADAGRGARRTVQSVYVTTGVTTGPGDPDTKPPGPNYRTGRRTWIDPRL